MAVIALTKLLYLSLLEINFVTLNRSNSLSKANSLSNQSINGV